MPVTCYSLKFYILAFLSVQTLCILGAHLGSLQSSVYCSACSWWNCSRIEWLLLLPLRRHMSILSCVILFKSSTMMQIWWPHCALFPPLYRNLTSNMIQTLSVEVLSSLTQLVTWWVWVCFQLTTLVSYVQLGVHVVEAYVFVKGGRSSYLFSQTTAINILFFKQAFTML